MTVKIIKKYNKKSLSKNSKRKRHNFLNRKWNKENPERIKVIKKKTYIKNPEKAREAVGKWRKENPELLKEIRDNSARKYLYKIRKEQFIQMKNKQKNRCLICKNKFLKTPHIDHCHKTNKIRGLLCSTCNTGLGCFKDNLKLLQAAIGYLQKSKKKRR